MKTLPSQTPDRPEKSRKRVVSALLRKDDFFLILERSTQVGSYQGYWSCVSGFVERDEDPLETALREVTEETGISKDSLSLLSQDGPNIAETETLVFESYWFLFDSSIHKSRSIGNIINSPGSNPMSSKIQDGALVRRAIRETDPILKNTTSRPTSNLRRNRRI